MQVLDLPAPPWIVGHRGVRGAVPENTVDSVLEAVRQRADMVEIDLQLTGDGELIVHHDPAVRVDGNESELVGRATLEEIKRCRQVRRRGGEEWAYEIPTLDEVLAAAPAELPLNLEIKRYDLGEDPAELIDRLAETIAGRAGVLLSSFDWPVLGEVRKKLPCLPLAPLGRLTANWDDLVEMARMLDAFSIHIHRGLAAGLGRKGLLDEPAAKERPILVYTVNRVAEAETLLGFGVAGFFTDRPGELREQIADPG